MSATGEEDVYIFAASAPAGALQQIRVVAEEKKPALIIIAPLFRLTRVKDGNDYAQVTAALEPLLVLARETGAHVLCVHHTGKGDREGGGQHLRFNRNFRGCGYRADYAAHGAGPYDQ